MLHDKEMDADHWTIFFIFEFIFLYGDRLVRYVVSSVFLRFDLIWYNIFCNA